MLRKNYLSQLQEESLTQKGYMKEIALELKAKQPMVVVLDDDPTGTQTVHGVSVVTDWEQSTLDEMFMSENSLFFILTNSRSFKEEKAYEVYFEIGKRIKVAADKSHKNFIVVSRGDSTLRGHYFAETTALEKGIDVSDCKQILIPAFFEGGRFTLEDVHYMLDGDACIPVSESDFAKDNTFGYKNSNLLDWVSEKTNGIIESSDIDSFSIEVIRKLGPDTISKKLLAHDSHKYTVVNALSYQDLEAFAYGLYKSNLSAIIRSSASFVNAIGGIEKKALLNSDDFPNSKNGGLTIVGSYVSKTSSQLKVLQKAEDFAFLELDVNAVLNSESRDTIISMSSRIDKMIAQGQDVVVYTSRRVVSGADGNSSLEVVNQVSNAIVDIVRNIKKEPRYILAKGGITSSDIAVKALGVKKAFVEGQVLPGVPVWQLGIETKFPSVPYIIFPGNVGDENALTNALTKLN